MRTIAVSQQECEELLQRITVGRLACSLDNQPYVVPVGFSYEPGCVYIFSTLGKKIECMRQNPKVCLQADEIRNESDWLSVIVTGTYLELGEPQYTEQRQHARKLLERHNNWWLNPLAERREQTDDVSIKTVFFRIDIEAMSGLRATP